MLEDLDRDQLVAQVPAVRERHDLGVGELAELIADQFEILIEPGVLQRRAPARIAQQRREARLLVLRDGNAYRRRIDAEIGGADGLDLRHRHAARELRRVFRCDAACASSCSISPNLPARSARAPNRPLRAASRRRSRPRQGRARGAARDRSQRGRACRRRRPAPSPPSGRTPRNSPPWRPRTATGLKALWTWRLAPEASLALLFALAKGAPRERRNATASYATAPNRAPTPAVSAIAKAPQNVTRTWRATCSRRRIARQGPRVRRGTPATRQTPQA